MTRQTLLASVCVFSLSSAAFADSVIIHQTDPEPTNSVVIKERTVEPDVVVRKKKVIVREESQPDVIIRESVE